MAVSLAACSPPACSVTACAAAASGCEAAGLAARGWVALGSYPPKAPTDPDVQNSRIRPATGAPVAPAVRALTANAAGTATAVTLAAAGGAQATELGGVPRNARVRCTVEPDAGVAGRPGACFGIAVRVAAAAGGGAQPRARAGVLRFRPHAQQVSLGTTHVRPDGALSESVISDVTGLDTPFTVDLVMSHDIVDVCIAGRRTVIGRHWNPAGDRLLLFAEHCSVAFRELEVRPLAAQ